MCLNFNSNLTRPGEDLQEPFGFERRQSEQTIDRSMAPFQHQFRIAPENRVANSLLSGFPGKMRPQYRTEGEQPAKKHICSQVQMVVSVDPSRWRAVQTIVLSQLG
jgi:hypothetical protein